MGSEQLVNCFPKYKAQKNEAQKFISVPRCLLATAYFFLRLLYKLIKRFDRQLLEFVF